MKIADWEKRLEDKAVPLGNGVVFHCHAPTAEVIQAGAAAAARVVGGLHDGRANLEKYGFTLPEMGALANLDVLAGLSVLVSAVTIAELLVFDWEGINDEDGEPVPFDPDFIAPAFRIGAPDGGPALLSPFMAWLDRPNMPVGADCRRLRELGKWEWSGGLTHCQGCTMVEADCARGGADEGARCPRFEQAPRTDVGVAAAAAARRPGAWRRAGMAGQIVALDYAGCLAHAEAAGCHDVGGLYRCLAAYEGGALEAAAEKAAKQ